MAETVKKQNQIEPGFGKFFKFEIGDLKCKRVDEDYEPTQISDSVIYIQKKKLQELRQASLVTTALILTLATLVGFYVFRKAQSFELIRKTRNLDKATAQTISLTNLETNKTISAMSYKNTKDIAIANSMRKYTQKDVVTIEAEDSEFTRVYYREATETGGGK